MRSATRSTRPRDWSNWLASETFLPTRLGMVTSRPWMAMRIAVMALRKAAEARMNNRKVIRVSHSSLSRRVMEEIVYRQWLTVNSTQSRDVKWAGLKPGVYKDHYFASGGGG